MFSAFSLHTSALVSAFSLQPSDFIHLITSDLRPLSSIFHQPLNIIHLTFNTASQNKKENK